MGSIPVNWPELYRCHTNVTGCPCLPLIYLRIPISFDWLVDRRRWQANPLGALAEWQDLQQPSPDRSPEFIDPGCQVHIATAMSPTT